MPSAVSIDLKLVAADLGLKLEQVERTFTLLDQGNTVAFITRYRKDQTSGLDEEQVQQIKREVTKLRLLGERKQTILRSVESQGKLTPELAAEIQAARSTKRLEDLYLPYKPKKQTLATLARQRGLEPLAREMLEAAPAAADLDARAADFVSSDRGLHSVAEVLHGVGHLLAERFGERADLRARLRKILGRSGQLVCAKVDASPHDGGKKDGSHSDAPPATAASSPRRSRPAKGEAPRAPSEGEGVSQIAGPPGASDTQPSESLSDAELIAAPTIEEATPGSRPEDAVAGSLAGSRTAPAKDRKRRQLENAFKDYFEFREPVTRVPPHRILAINRGERAKVLRVKVEDDVEALNVAAVELLVPDGHPHGAFLQACVRDALQRLVLPSLEREIRRELTEKAEEHAVGVFVRNLRKLLLQPPVRGRRILAMDPGFRNGCKFAALDEFGNFLEGGVFHVLGGEEIRLQSRTLIADTIRRHSLSVIAIGNGTGCRECEQLVAEALSNELSGSGVVYVVVNEAGASVYSTSPIGREELPTHDPVMRGALSIGRRLLDPLSELVKINPANIGVGLYQHDVKGRHLRESLDAVVESCVNYVGVDVNTASPSLLRYVSGLNQLTARRLYEYRLEHGPFRSRSEFKDVPGLGEAAFVQAAGFLKIPHGDNPLDATWIHPESYGIASRVLEKLQGSVAELAGATGLAPKTGSESPGGASTSQKPSSTLNAVEGPGPFRDSFADRAAKLDLPAISRELQIGEMLLRDILVSLTRPGRDPRDDFPPPAFRTGILKLEDLKSGMELTGTVLNVVDFGAFVNIGISDCALVHISQLANRYVRDPHEVVSVGDVLTVWVLDVDKVRRRVSLTAIRPATEKKPSAPPSQPAAADAARAGKAPLARTSQRPDRDSRAKHPAKNRPQKGGSGPRAKPKPKPSKPITQAMVEGREPMRSFSDLAQFFEKKREPADDDKSENK